MAKADKSPIDEFIQSADPEVQPILHKIKQTVRASAPDAEEIISYRMPAFRQNGILIYFAPFKNHIGVYPPVSGDEKLEKSLARYRGPKGNLKFPLAEPIPYDLIEKIVKLKVRQNTAKAAEKQAKR